MIATMSETCPFWFLPRVFKPQISFFYLERVAKLKATAATREEA
jgi:hypothetical protein